MAIDMVTGMHTGKDIMKIFKAMYQHHRANLNNKCLIQNDYHTRSCQYN